MAVSMRLPMDTDRVISSPRWITLCTITGESPNEELSVVSEPEAKVTISTVLIGFYMSYVDFYAVSINSP